MIETLTTNEPVIVEFASFDDSIPRALDQLGASEVLASQKRILIKPNLVNDSPHPITTSSDTCKAIVEYLLQFCEAEIVIAEGCGDSVLETDVIFDRLGYSEIAKKYHLPLVDLNHAPVVRLENPDCPIFPEMFLPEICLSHFIISVPVLKAHSLSEMTGSLKNMMGFAPPEYYSGRHGIWKKALFHQNMHQSIVDLNRYRSPDLTILDASIGMAQFHLGGPPCQPPLMKIVAGYDPVKVDRIGAGMLGLDWKMIPYLATPVTA